MKLNFFFFNIIKLGEGKHLQQSFARYIFLSKFCEILLNRLTDESGIELLQLPNISIYFYIRKQIYSFHAQCSKMCNHQSS